MKYNNYQDEIFSSPLDLSFLKIQDENAIFLKFWAYNLDLVSENTPYVMSTLPGIKEGISGSILSGYNVGVINNLEESKIESVMKVIEYMTSKELQKDFVLKNVIISGILSLYDDPDICSMDKNCQIYKKIQATTKPIDNMGYFEKFKTYFFEYLYGDVEAEDVMKTIDDIKRIYSISIDSEETSAGFIIFIILIIMVIVMTLSLVVLFIKSYEIYFSIFSKKTWILIMIGIMMPLFAGFTTLGEVKSSKCHLQTLFYSLGYTIIYAPFIYKLIVLFHDENKYSSWIHKHKYFFIFILIGINAMFNGISMIKTFNINDIIVERGENFQECKLKGTLSMVMYFLSYGYNIINGLILLILVFLEWNLKKIFYDVRFVVTSIYLNLITSLIFLIINSFEFNNYILYFVTQEGFYILIAIENYLTIYGSRLIFPLLISKEKEMEFVNQIRGQDNDKKSTNRFINTENLKSVVTNDSSKNSSSITDSFYGKILKYHNIK